jgi:Tfp pilus assembly protein PilO
MKLTVREKGIVVLAGVLAIGYAGVAYVVDPFLESQTAVQEAIEQKRLEYQQLVALAAERERYQRKVDDLRLRVSEAEAMLLKEDKAPVVAAQVQEVVHQFGRETGVSIMREAVLRPKEQEVVVEVPVEVSLKGSLREVQEFVYKVESHDKMLTIPQIAIRSSPASNGLLSVEMHIAGHMPRGRKS